MACLRELFGPGVEKVSGGFRIHNHALGYHMEDKYVADLYSSVKSELHAFDIDFGGRDVGRTDRLEQNRGLSAE